MKVNIESSWQNLLKEEFEKEYFINLVQFVKAEYANGEVYPPGPLIFNAFNSCPLQNLKIVIIGQDPYHTPRIANGLAFSTNNKNRVPPSLQNIFKEIKSDLQHVIDESPDLSKWANQGVLLLNATLTVKKGQAASHQGKGWETFTDSTIKLISLTQENLVFLLWGAYAQKKKELIDTNKHLVLESAHPSPFSANKGFFGNKHFSKANQYLKLHGKTEIAW